MGWIMTPQQKAMADILQVSLFKWAESTHQVLESLRRRGVDPALLNDIARQTEEVIDISFKDSMGGETSMMGIDILNAHIVKMKQLLRD
jgi:hypothetical protein